MKRDQHTPDFKTGNNGTIHAYLAPAPSPGDYAIDVPALGLRLDRERFPANRMAKALHELGHIGRMNVYGPTPATGQPRLRYSVDIAGHAAQMASETSRDGFQRQSWRPGDVAALTKRLVDYRMAAQDAREASPTTPTAGNDNRQAIPVKNRKG